MRMTRTALTVGLLMVAANASATAAKVASVPALGPAGWFGLIVLLSGAGYVALKRSGKRYAKVLGGRTRETMVSYLLTY